MRTIVRLLPRLLLLGVAAGVLLVLGGRGRSAHANTLDPPSLPSAPAAPAPPPVTAPSVPPAPDLPQAPEPPPVTAPQLPPVTAPSAPDLPSFPVPGTAPTPPGPPEGVPGPPAPAPPPLPDAPGVDPSAVTGVVALVPAVPSVSPTAPGLPEIPRLPDPRLPDPRLPNPAAPAPGLIDVGTVPNAPTTSGAPGLVPTTPEPEPAPSRAASTDGGATFDALDEGSPPARGPPTDVPQHSCSGGGTSASARNAPTGFLAAGVDNVARRARLLCGACSCVSTWLLEPLLRPD